MEPIPMNDPLWQPGRIEAAVAHLRAADPRLAAMMDLVGPCALVQTSPGDPFAALAEAIIYQQLAGKAAASICRRFCDLFPARSFPEAADIASSDDDFLRGAGLSGPKIRALRHLANAVIDRSLDLQQVLSLSDDDVRAAVSAIKGIGRWTSDMFLLFHLGRPDVLPVGDLGVRKAVQRVYRMRSLPEPPKLEKTARAWRPFRSVATWYLWRSLGVVTIGPNGQAE